MTGLAVGLGVVMVLCLLNFGGLIMLIHRVMEIHTAVTRADDKEKR